MLALLALTSASLAWAQFVDDPTMWYYVTLQAKVSTPSCGANPGQVQLTFTDVNGNIINPWLTGAKPNCPYSEKWECDQWQDDSNGFGLGASEAQNGLPKSAGGNGHDWVVEVPAFEAGYNAGYDWYMSGQSLNTANPSEWAANVSLNGYAPVHIEGLEVEGMISSYAYFNANVKENDGWYFTGWSSFNGGTEHGGNVGEEKLFKIFPGATSGIANITTQSIYATFQPVMVADYKVDGTINVGTSAGSNSTTVIFDAVGERVSTSDFTVAVPDAHFSASITSCVDNKVTVTVTFTNPGDLDEDTYRGNVTLTSKSGCSELTAAVYARVSEGSATQASLYEGKVAPDKLVESGNVETLIAKATANQIVALNANYASALAVNKTVALDLNGYNLTNTLDVNGGEVTLVYSKYGGRITDKVTVNAGKLILNGGIIEAGTAVEVKTGASLEQNGATINATSYGILNAGTTLITEGTTTGTTAGVKSTGTLTVKGGTLTGSYALWVAGGTAAVEKGNLSGTGYGIYSEATTTTEKLATVYGGTNAVYVAGGTTTLNNGKFASETEAPLHKGSGTLTLNAGYFKVNELGIALPITKEIFNVSAGPEYNAGYRYFVGDSEIAQLSGVGVCRIGTTPYTTLEDALAYANNNKDEEVVIVMLNDYTLPAGYYTLPAKATLIVPMSEEYETPHTTITRVSNNGTISNPRRVPTAFRRLTFANGVNLDVHGDIELGGSQRASSEQHASAPDGPYGLLVMNEGSKMVLQDGSELRAWGYMIGKGETDARRGSTIREQFEMGDWKGGQESYALLSSDIFPITQYYIQNIESPVKYHPGSVLSTTVAVSVTYGSMGITAAANDVKIVGVSGRDEAMFLMDNEADADNTWVRKWYDAANDIQTYEVNSGAHIGSMVLRLGQAMGLDLTMNSGQFNLPITNNMKIHLLTGTMDFTQNTALLPGAEVEVDKGSTVLIKTNTDPNIKSGALFVYDKEEWDTYAFNGKYTKRVLYSASLNAQPTVRNEGSKPESAKINVHGTFNTEDGYVYTSASGANIFSSNADAGTFIFNMAVPTEGVSISQVKGVSNHVETTFVPALLKNGAGVSTPYASTAGAQANTSFCYMNNQWTTMMYAQCFTAEVSGFDPSTYMPIVEAVYAKPQEYVQIIADINFVTGDVTGNDDHTFSDAAGEGRLFILLNDCQWWEVENVDNLYHCIHPNNDTYYYWGEDPETLEEGWLEKKYTITWKNWDGTIIQTMDNFGNPVDEYEVTYGTEAEFFGTNPTRNEDIDYTYDFAGWTPALGRVTQDVTYTATYTKKPRKYTIIFQNEGGVEIERQFLTHNEMPVCENVPTKIGHTLEWSPAIAAVTGNATYTAIWHEDPPTDYAVTFFDYDGTTKLKPTGSEPYMVAVGAMPEAPADPDGKHATAEYEYEFDHWSPAIEVVSATSAKSYTAVYREVEKTYDVRFFKEDGTTQIGATQSLAYGATPTVPTGVTPASPQEGYSYILEWKNKVTNKNVETVTAAADYKAVFTGVKNKYTVTLKTNDPVGCTLTGAGIYEYGTSITIRANVKSGYSFVKWQETGNTNAEMTGYAVTEDVTLTAVINHEPDYRRTVSNNIGTLCIPYDIPADGIEGAVFYELQGKDENGKLVFDEVTSLQAGHPYIFQAYASEIKLYGSANNVDPVTVNQMKGSYIDFNLSITEENKHQVVYIANNKFWFCDDLVGQGLDVVANRCYILNYSAIGSAPNHAPARRRVVLGTNGTNIATDIDNVNGDEVQGTNVRKVLIDNMLYIQRGEKLYNVEGQMVR